MLEINQAGLSWLTVLRKRPAFRAAFAGFEVDRVAAFGDSDVARLLADPGIVRNRQKVEAAIANAPRIQELRPLAWLFRRLACGTPPALARGMDPPLPADLPLHWRADRR